MDTKYIKIKDMAARLNLHRNTIAKEIDRGQIKAYKFSGQLFVTEAEIARYVESCKV